MFQTKLWLALQRQARLIKLFSTRRKLVIRLIMLRYCGMRVNPKKGAEFATQLANDESGALVDIERVSLFDL
jgi:hypothetical protein